MARNPNDKVLRARWRFVSRVGRKRGSTVVEEAKTLLQKIGISGSKDYTMDDLDKIQAHYSNMTFLCYQTGMYTRPIYEGPYTEESNCLVLLLKDDHYYHVKRLAPLMKAKFFCFRCKTVASCSRRFVKKSITFYQYNDLDTTIAN